MPNILNKVKAIIGENKKYQTWGDHPRRCNPYNKPWLYLGDNILQNDLNESDERLSGLSETDKKIISLHSDEDEDRIHDENLHNHSAENRETLERFCGPDSSKINSHLRDRYSGGNYVPDMRDDIGAMDKAVGDKKLNGNFHSFHGSNVEIPVGDTHIPNYTSTTTDYNKALYFSRQFPEKDSEYGVSNPNCTTKMRRHIIKYNLRDGDQGLSVKNISPNQTYGENEILLNRGQNIKIEKPHLTDDGKYIFNAHILSSDPKSLEANEHNDLI